MGKRRRNLGSAPCLDNRSKPDDKLQENRIPSHKIERKDENREANRESDERIILRHWYRYGFDGGDATES